MIFEFRGLSRHVFTHDYELKPGRYGSRKADAPLEWETSTTAHGRIYNMGLSGNFRVEIGFQIQELKNWLSKYVEEEPEEALKLISKMQANAIIQLFKKPSANEEDPKT
ncbi:MAG: hypothetical protein CMQ38_12790 [Gammaproteobacteria bacterium]|nr:hypothetical protein [Gammaproteobacteria bacterium]|tara:strand:+ start:249 stop:575 length:327 start_codon:yes stop_codon:yes gene_type:complete